MKDRGLIKWFGFMTPEHNSILKNWQLEEMYEDRILLSEEQIEEIEQNLNQSLSRKTPVNIRYYDGATHQYRILFCRVHACDYIQQSLRVCDLLRGGTQKIAMNDIVKVDLEEVTTDEAD